MSTTTGSALRRVVVAVVAAGAFAVAAAVALAVHAVEYPFEAPLPLAPAATLAATAVVGAALFALKRQGFVFRWRGESTRVSLDEAAVALGALVLPLPHLVLACAGASAATQIVHRREPAKAAFNVAQYALAGAAAGAAVLLLGAAGAPAPWSALLAPVAFSATSMLLVSVPLAAAQSMRVLTVFRGRFMPWIVASAALGASLAGAAFALWRLEPASVLLLAPLLVYLRRFGRLSEWADDEIATHELLADISADLAGESDLDRVADRILGACHRLFSCGEAHVVLDVGNGPPRVRRRSFEPGASGAGGISAPLARGDRERLGEVIVYPPAGGAPYGEREQHLLRTLAAGASAAAANGRAFELVARANQELKESVRRLENMNRELEEFTLWTTHDMREPLRSVGTLAQILDEDWDSLAPGEARELARKVAAGADRLKERVKGLHAFSRIVQEDRSFEDVDLDAVARHVVAALGAKIAEKGARVRVATGLPVVRAQPHRLDQVMMNLVENALKYGPSAGLVVEIACEARADEVVVTVADNGPGIPLEYHERVFQLFQRGPPTAEAGTGAGLAIVKRIVEQHGGRVALESAPGRGAAFSFTVPRAVAVAPALAGPAASVLPRGLAVAERSPSLPPVRK